MNKTTIQHIATLFSVDKDALASTKSPQRRRSIIREFSLNTSTHGIPGIARSRSIGNCLFWTVALISFATVMIIFIVQSFRDYFAYPTQTSVSVVVQRTQPFPAFSFCNYSPVRFDLFIEPFLNYTNSLNLTNTNDTSTISTTQANYIRDYFRNAWHNEGKVDRFLFSLKSIMIGCYYNGIKCMENDFTSFFSPKHGFCYTFNAKTKLNGSRIRQTTDSGETGILDMQLYTHSHQYVPYITNGRFSDHDELCRRLYIVFVLAVSSGIAVMIHDNADLPLIDIAGIELGPSKKHKLSFKKRTYQLLPPPYSQCTEDVSPVMQAMFQRYQETDYRYSQVLCNTLCIQQYVYEQCDCVDPAQWTARSVKKRGTNEIITALLCKSSDPCYSAARSRIINDDTIWKNYCSDCKEACFNVDFTVTPSSVASPPDVYFPSIKLWVEYISDIPLPSDWNNSWEKHIEKNFVALQVFAETSYVETFEQTPAIGWVDLISNIGGHTGLWIGISFLSIMEIIEMLYRLVRSQIHKMRHDTMNVEELCETKL